MSLRRFLTGVVALGAIGILFLAAAPPARADNLTNFINNSDTITASPVTFTGIPSLVVTGNASETFDGTTIAVNGINDASKGPGLSFIGTLQANAGQTLDVDFNYSATATGRLIEDVSMTINTAGVSGTGSLTISETVWADAAHTKYLATPFVFVYDPSGPQSQYYDIHLITPVSTVYVVKDISLIGGSGVVAMSNFQQNFSLATPEPASMGMAATAIVAFAGYGVRRRMKKS